ncbi:MAG: electron transfer flavoprotein subunit beta/FixA family protein [Thermoguttaceae bacterium]|nr:electron transfer flavoprotein subunit beta/FixA family protein [Thermoguttaceae bacterium]MBQ9456371.1 electron transfer flavoprotein subunit beta/FixA family protein [Thermoguttaceae bacterium]MDO4858520.1 electron transfer flavoprotein subunit beta/FixA family protein [Thermoguttaceae bacterium]
MGFNSIVCVKQVPDTANISSDAMTPEGTVNRAALPAIFNPEDLHALETALEIRDRFGGTVTVLTMGLPKAAEILRSCLYRGADRAILLTDRRAAGSDTLATSYILSQVVRTIGNYDFVLCGRQAIDGDTAQTGPQIAEKLGLPQVTYLEKVIDVKDGSPKTARLRRNTGNGFEVVDVQLPALLTVIETANDPRPFAARKVMRFKHAAVPAEVTPEKAEELKAKGLLMEQWTLDDVNADFDRCGMAGSPTKVFRIESIVLTKEGFVQVEPTEEGVTGLVQELIADRTL